MRTRRRLGAVLAGIGLLAILALTLGPNARQTGLSAQTPLLCLVCGESGGVDVVLNLLLFLPLSAGLALAGWRWGRIVAACALLSLGIETAQYFLVTGRDASLSDLITNTISGALGAGLGARLGLLLAPHPALARRLSRSAGAAWLGLVAFTGLTMRPWAPDGPLRNYCSPVYPTGEVFSSTARAMTLNGVALACDQDLQDGEAARRAMRRGEIHLETVADLAPPEGGRQVIHLIRGGDASLVFLAQQDRTAILQVPTAAKALRLFAPVVRLPEGFPATDGGPVTLVGEVRHGRVRLATSHEGTRRATELALSPSHGWTLVFAGGLRPGAGLRLLTALWLGALILPAGYWAGYAAGRARAFAMLAGAVIVALGAVPALAGLEPVQWSDWAGAASGLVLGGALSRVATYLQSRCGSPSTGAYSSS
jgi:hypothetical protein